MRMRLSIGLVLCMTLGATGLSAQALGDIGGRRLMLNDAGTPGGTKNTISIEPPSAATLTTDYTLVLPSMVGTSGSLLTTTVAGPVGTTSWLAPGTNGQVLTITGGVPTWSTLANNAWALTGNAGTTPGTNFIGTTDNQAFEIHVNEAGLATEGARRVLRIEPNASSANFIGGHSTNGLGLGTTAVGVTIAGGGSQGQANRASDDYNTIGGGRFNIAGSNDATPGNAQYATVAGGSVNQARAQGATVAGGESNTASGTDAVVAGGLNNQASGVNSAVGGGSGNSASGQNTTVAGGATNAVTGTYGAVTGGQNNTIATGSDYSAVLGGRGLTLSGAGSLGFQSNNAAGANNVSIAAANTAYLGNVNLWLGNNDGTARQVRFYEPQATSGAFPAAGVNYVAFQAPVIASTNDQTYTLPSTIGTAGQVLRIATTPAPTATAATLEWGLPATTAWALTGNASTDPSVNYLGTSDAQPLVVRTSATERMRVSAAGNLGVGTNDPQVTVDINGGMAVRPASNVSVAADNVTITVGNRSYIVLDPGTGNRQNMTLSDGLQTGQMLIIRVLQTATGSVQLPDAPANNVSSSGLWIGRADDTILLIWSGIDWVEISRSNN